MRFSPLKLGAGLSRLSWSFIEFFTLAAVFFLPFSKSIAEAAIGAAIGLWILRKFPWDEPWPRIPRIFLVCYGFFLAVTAISVLQAAPHELATALRGLGKWLKFLAIFSLAFDYFEDGKRTSKLTAVFLLSLTLTVADGFWQMLAGQDLVKGYFAAPGRFVRMGGPMPSPNDLAAFLLLGLPVLFFLWKEKKTWSPSSAGLAALFVVLGVAFVSTLSRGAFLALFAASAFYLLCTQKKKTLWLLLLLPAVLFVSPILRYNFFGSLAAKDITIGERLDMWQVAFRMIRLHPLLGNGVNLFGEKYASFSRVPTIYKGYAHNCYLQMAAEIGILGLIAFVVPFFVFLPKAILEDDGRSAFKSGLLVGIPAYLLQSGLDTNFYALQAAIIFWVLWGMTAVLAKAPDA